MVKGCIRVPKRVMVFTPVYRLQPETVAAVLALKWAGPIRWVFQRDNPTDDGRVNILHQYQEARRLFLAGNDDLLLIIEDDIIPPSDALLKLAALDADVAYGVYRFRKSNVINVYERYPGEARNVGESLSLHPAKLREAVRARVTKCSGGGLGCTLLRRSVLMALDFRHEETAHCDTYFNRDLLRGGFKQMADMRVVCGHVSETGRVLWPDGVGDER